MALAGSSISNPSISITAKPTANIIINTTYTSTSGCSKAVNYHSFMSLIAKTILLIGSPESWVKGTDTAPSVETLTDMLKSLIHSGSWREDTALTIKDAFDICEIMCTCLGRQFVPYNKTYRYRTNKNICSENTAKNMIVRTFGSSEFHWVYTDCLGDLKESQSYWMLSPRSSFYLYYNIKGGGGGGAGSIICGGNKNCKEFYAVNTSGSGADSKMVITPKGKEGQREDRTFTANGGSGISIKVTHSGGGVSSGNGYIASTQSEAKNVVTENSDGAYITGTISVNNGDHIRLTRGRGGDGSGGVTVVEKKDTYAGWTSGVGTSDSIYGKPVNENEIPNDEPSFAGSGGGGGGNNWAPKQGIAKPAGKVNITNGQDGRYTEVKAYNDWGSSTSEVTFERAGCYKIGGNGGYSDAGGSAASGGATVGAKGINGGYRYKEDNYSYANGGGGGASGAITGHALWANIATSTYTHKVFFLR